jgi:hypothetical protein
MVMGRGMALTAAGVLVGSVASLGLSQLVRSQIDVVTVLFTVQPGGHSGWHTHPGPAIFTIRAGTLTMYEGDDPSCTPQLFPTGTGSIEADTSGHIHMLRNETTSVAETVVTFLVPVGAPIRTDLPDPGTCPF